MRLADAELVRGETVGIEATTLEANGVADQYMLRLHLVPPVRRRFRRLLRR